MGERKKQLIKKYFTNGCDENFESHKRIFKKGYCFICEENFATTETADATAALNRHIEEKHLQKWKTELGDREEKLAMEDRQEEDEKEETKVLNQETSFSKDDGGYHCHKCDITFTTSLPAMLEHKKQHERSSIMKIYTVIPNETQFRPEQHEFNENSGKFGPGRNTKLKKIIIPNVYGDEWQESKILKCRHCKNFEIEYEEAMGGIKKAKRINKLLEHESKCKKKKK